MFDGNECEKLFIDMSLKIISAVGGAIVSIKIGKRQISTARTSKCC